MVLTAMMLMSFAMLTPLMSSFWLRASCAHFTAFSADSCDWEGLPEVGDHSMATWRTESARQWIACGRDGGTASSRLRAASMLRARSLLWRRDRSISSLPCRQPSTELWLCQRRGESRTTSTAADKAVCRSECRYVQCLLRGARITIGAGVGYSIDLLGDSAQKRSSRPADAMDRVKGQHDQGHRQADRSPDHAIDESGHCEAGAGGRQHGQHHRAAADLGDERPLAAEQHPQQNRHRDDQPDLDVPPAHPGHQQVTEGDAHGHAGDKEHGAPEPLSHRARDRSEGHRRGEEGLPVGEQVIGHPPGCCRGDSRLHCDQQTQSQPNEARPEPVSAAASN